MTEIPAEEPRPRVGRELAHIPVEVPPVDAFHASLQTLGTILRAPIDQEPPTGWVRMDGAKYARASFPEFAELMGITETYFTVPAPTENARGENHVGYIIKLADVAGDPRILEI